MNAPAKITPCLWFNFNVEEAVAHYLSIFKRGLEKKTMTRTFSRLALQVG